MAQDAASEAKGKRIFKLSINLQREREREEDIYIYIYVERGGGRERGIGYREEI